jgi:hypothetical protein
MAHKRRLVAAKSLRKGPTEACSVEKGTQCKWPTQTMIGAHDFELHDYYLVIYGPNRFSVKQVAPGIS